MNDFRKMLEAIDAIVNRYYPEQREESPEAEAAQAVKGTEKTKAMSAGVGTR